VAKKYVRVPRHGRRGRVRKSKPNRSSRLKRASKYMVETCKRLDNEIEELDSRIGRYTLMLPNLERLRKLVRRRDSLADATRRPGDAETWKQLMQRVDTKQEEIRVQLQRLIRDAVCAEDLARSRTEGMSELVKLIPGVHDSFHTRHEMETESFLDRVIPAVKGKLQTLKNQRDKKHQLLVRLRGKLKGMGAIRRCELERCLAECTTRPGRCRNPAVRDGRCWLPTHRDQ